jgi:hypothetical protein
MEQALEKVMVKILEKRLKQPSKTEVQNLEQINQPKQVRLNNGSTNSPKLKKMKKLRSSKCESSK